MAGFKKYDRSKFGRDSERSERPERSSFGRKPSFGGRDSERGSRFGRRESPRGSFGRDSERPRFGGRDKPELEMFDVVCDRCEKECKVPFKPTRGKPVYCSECFSKKEESGASRGEGSSSRDLEEINRKLDKIMHALKID